MYNTHYSVRVEYIQPLHYSQLLTISKSLVKFDPVHDNLESGKFYYKLTFTKVN